MNQLFKILIICLPFTSICFGQNLVPNPSFEDTVQCPTPNSQLQYATGWVNPNGYSPDYFHSCANISNPNFGVPNSYNGFQNAKTGVAYGGIYMPVNAGNDLREYIQIQLTDTLIAGLEYLVKFHVSLADSSIFSVNSIGAYLSNSAINSPTLKVFNVTPQVVNNPTINPLTDKNIWYEISDTIIAVGGENFITIGNFEFDSVVDTTTVIGGSSPSYASYYYIDDVSIEIKPTSINEFSTTNIFSFYPNPANDILNIRLNKIGNYTIQLFDVIGNIISNKIVLSNNVIDITNYSNGIYFIQLSEKNKILNTSKLIINH